MGNCVCVRKDRESDFKFKWSVDSETVNVPTGINNAAIDWEKEHGRLCSSPLSSPINHVPGSPEFSKGDGEETFFDSHPWLDSDNEDFFSVNGDNTPSYRSTPVWHAQPMETALSDKPPFPMAETATASEAATATETGKDVKKQLIELFRDSFNDDQGRSKTNSSLFQLQLINMDHPDDTNRRLTTSVKVKSAQSTPCCIPSLARSLSVGDKKKRLSPHRHRHRHRHHGGG